MIRVLIADDHSLIREGLAKVLARQSDIRLVAEASNGTEAARKAGSDDVDVAILDFNMPGRSGLDALSHIRALRPKLPVIILSMMPERDLALRAFRGGADGFVSKDSAAEEIVEAVRTVASGAKYVSAAVAELLAVGIAAPESQQPHEALSNREFQIMRMIASGHGTRQIADELSLSVNTIATYRRRVLEKLGLKNDADIIRHAIQYRLID
ncbi:response regulator [Marinibaculum pumilum]|uniref:Response regulator n=1 Tax=Marinibaculum pumilum TaxID=1766165 RepID=A0ABV7L7C1_9PROT